MKRLALLFLLLPASVLAADFVSIGEGAAVLYDAPSLKARKLFAVSAHYPFEKVVALEKWVKVRDRNGQLSWVEKSQLSDKNFVMVSAPLADIREGQAPEAKIVFQAKTGVLLEKLETAPSGWVKVRHEAGQGGYVKSSQVWGG